jgi:tRNA pseudouridine65 synthase
VRDPNTGEEISLPILYRDEYVVAIDKPASLLVHRTRIDRQARVFALQVVRDQIGQLVYPVHRLDKPTSGVLLFGLSPEAGKRLTNFFSCGEVRKTYVAVVRGWLDEEGSIGKPLGDLRDYTSSGLPGEPKEARSDYRRLATVELPHPVGRYETARYSLGVIYPQTGKRHQVRRHMRHIGHPVIGDRRHGDRDHNRFFEGHFASDRLLLTAMELTFPHPFKRHEVTVTAGFDEHFASILRRLGWRQAVPSEWFK